MSQEQGTADDWMQDPAIQAAAFEGMAGNPAFSTEERLGHALEACRLLHEVIGAMAPDYSKDPVNRDPDWYIAQRAQDDMWHRQGES